jgi:hypothetical protein
MTQADSFQCLNCGQITYWDGARKPAPTAVLAPSPAAQRIMHAPGNNNGVHAPTLQVGAAEWASTEDPSAEVIEADDEAR